MRCAALAAVALVTCCAQETPRATQRGILPAKRDGALFLVAARQKPRIAESLRLAGFEPAADLLDAQFLLRVTVGNEKGFRDCGTLNNVKYSLRMEGQTILEITGSGWTGTCSPNLFDDLSQRLRKSLEAGTQEE
jgi:hypothetical protein